MSAEMSEELKNKISIMFKAKQEQEDAQRMAVETTSEEEQEQVLLFEHLYRKCTCGSGDVWSECNGKQGDSSSCG